MLNLVQLLAWYMDHSWNQFNIYIVLLSYIALRLTA
jgi:hypothetical protein